MAEAMQANSATDERPDGGNRFIFIGGCARSGTTLLQNMLDSHPDVLGGPEFLHLVDIISLRRSLLTSVGNGWIDLFCSAEEVDQHIKALIEKLLIPLADEHGSKLLSEKSPENVMVFGDLVELFPRAKFVFIVRDPRAVVASLLATGARARAKGEAPPPFAANLQAAMSHVRSCLRAGFDAAKASDAIYTVVYEQLVQSPEPEAKQLCEFLALPWAEAMLRPGEQKHLGEAAITENSKEIWYDKKTYNSNPNQNSLTKWQADLTPTQQRLVSQQFRHFPELQALGYTFEDHHLSIIARIRSSAGAMAIRVVWSLKRRLRTLLLK